MENQPPVFAVVTDRRQNLHGWGLSLWVGGFGNLYYLQSERLSPRAPCKISRAMNCPRG
jgi:hypothetical protein